MAANDGSFSDVIETLFRRRDVMEAVVERPMDKPALIEVTGTSRSTVSRALRDLQTVELVEQTNGEYVPTPFGAFVFNQFVRFTDIVQLGREMRELLPHLPVSDLTFDLSYLADADITFSTRVEPVAPLERVAELKEGASRARTLAPGKNPVGLEAHYHAVTERGQRFEAVCPPGMFDTVAADSDQREMLLELLDHKAVDIYIADGTLPVPLGIVDETAFIGVENEQGSPLALIESDNPHIHRWAEIEFSTHCEDATALTPAEFRRRWHRDDT